LDTVGFGDSAPPPWPPSIERWAAVAHELLDALGLGIAGVVGHHTGGGVVIEMAACRGERLRQPTLVVRATADRFAAPRAEALRARPHDARIVDVEGGGVALPDQMPEAFAAVVEAFLADGGA
jgi:pimeloyl-ACP methyl ester carboxylesterase